MDELKLLEFIEKITRIKDDNIKSEVQEALLEVLYEKPSTDRRIILKKLKRINSVSEPFNAEVAYVEFDKKKWRMVINRDRWREMDWHEKRKTIRHEVDELLQYVKYKEHLHMLVFAFDHSKDKDMSYSCSICNESVDEGYALFEFHSSYADILHEIFEVKDPYEVFICLSCMIDCCQGCPDWNECFISEEVYCKFPKEWLDVARELRSKKLKQHPSQSSHV